MTRDTADEYDLKQCGRCAAWIPRTATMCAYCGTSSPDARIDSSPPRTPIGLPRGVTVTRVLIVANLAYFLFSVWTEVAWAKAHGAKADLVDALIEGDFPAGLTLSGWYEHSRVVAGAWWRVLTSVFLHGGLIHLGMNMFALRNLGELAEYVFGGAKMLAVYLVCGAASALAVSVWHVHLLGEPGAHVPPLVGASGAIFGIGGMLAAFLLRRGTARGREIGRSLATNLGAMLLIGLFVPIISNVGHVGGLIPGALFGLVVRERFSTALSPQSRRNWWLAATLVSVAAVVAIGSGVAFAVRALGETR